MTRMNPPFCVAFSDQLLDGRGTGQSGRPPAMAPWKMSSCRHSTPFGMPVVPPV